ncbi:MAG: aspartyl-tRNA(Asn)/glutamyl-tRNA(Gln) amidotransferase subunit [Chloroflexota bacterium]|jgi:aspartyl-tRNA(Asn)/glutamyl-tRNA(Gln) amidotransferase subunit A|nr:aspartyl-tRNA(Asn)/glutamyl-tRNA(Gln) amidotransferase subunit [Chloroflexota bacterium]
MSEPPRLSRRDLLAGFGLRRRLTEAISSSRIPSDAPALVPHVRGLAELSQALMEHRLAPADVMGEVASRVQARESTAGPFTALRDPEALMELALDAEYAINMGGYRGRLHAMPFVVADSFAAADPLRAEPATAGSLARLNAAGAILIGTTRVIGEDVDGPHDSRNADPAWERGHMPTAAAVESGLAAAGLATDTAGWVREAAGLVGIVGLKPTYGRISRAELTPVAWSLDHVGILTRSVEDAALVLNALAGPDAGDSTAAPFPAPDFTASLHRPIAEWRIGVPPAHLIDRHHPDVHRAYFGALDRLATLGAVVVEVPLPGSFEPAAAAHALIELVEQSTALLSALRDGAAGELSASTRARILAGTLVDPDAYERAQRVRAMAIRELRALLVDVDVLATPAQETVMGGTASGALEFRTIFNLTGFPALVVPVAATGLPVGIQLITRPFEEATILTVGEAVAAAR